MVDIAVYLTIIFIGFRHIEVILKLSADVGETAYWPIPRLMDTINEW